jgi:D-alanyl-D-alanine carboxypeptidase (penicillin-binding protein 5/6)
LIALCATGALMLAPVALAAPPPQLSVRAAILVDAATGQELYGVEPNRELAIASTTKLMTALITLQHVHHLDTIFTQNDWYPAADDSQIGLVPGERMSVHDLLLALMLPSADDAAEDLAYNVGRGSVTRFIGMMNAEARAIGLTRTHYSTPSGLDTPGNYSTAADLVKLAHYDLTHSAFFARIVALPSAVLHPGDDSIYVTNRNDLVGAVPWIDGVKTGHTDDAGYVLVASGHRGGMPLISAVLGTASEQARDANTMALLDYGFSEFRTFTPVVSGDVLARLAVRYRTGARADVVASRTFTRALARHTHVRVLVQAPRRLTGPLRRHADIGTAVVLANGRSIARIPLLLARALPAVSGLTIAAQFVTKPMMLVLILVALGAVSAFLMHRRRRTASGSLEAA